MDEFNYKNKYNHIVSFGCMCSCALFLRKNGFRDSSYFFDWLTSDFFGNIKLIENDFMDATNPAFFVQDYPEYSHLVRHTKYNFIYTHVFDSKRTYLKQKKDVDKYILKRIDNFRKVMADNTLLVYYCRDLCEQKKIEESVPFIKHFIEKTGQDLVFIFNNAVGPAFPFKSFVIPYNNIHHPIGGEVSYPFEGENVDNIVTWLNDRYDNSKKSSNLHFKQKTSIFKRILNKLRKHKPDVLKF